MNISKKCTSCRRLQDCSSRAHMHLGIGWCLEQGSILGRGSTCWVTGAVAARVMVCCTGSQEAQVWSQQQALLLLLF